MPNFFSRLAAAFTAPAQDPREAYASAGERQTQMLQRVRASLSHNATLRQRLEARLATLQNAQPALEEKARQAVKANREDVARLALHQQVLAQREAHTLVAHLHAIQHEEQRLSLLEQQLSTQLEAWQARQAVAAARYSAAEAQVLAHESTHHFGEELMDLGSSLEQTESETEALQARAEALEAVLDSTEALPAEDVLRAVEAKLAELRD
jgi:phage shock protein A